MTTVSKIIQGAGLVDVSEFSRWGANVPPQTAVPVDAVPALLERKMASHDAVRVKETDLDVVHAFEHTKKRGMLHLESLGGDEHTIPVEYGVTKECNIIIPWVGVDVKDAVVDCLVSLQEGTTCVALVDPREVYVGDHVAFTVWRKHAQ